MVLEYDETFVINSICSIIYSIYIIVEYHHY